MPECPFCDRCFSYDFALEAHCRDKADHPYYCAQCNRSFTTSNALNQHLENAAAHQERDSESYDSSESSESDDEEQTYCSSCRRSFVDKQALFQHLASNPIHNWCFMCSRDFSSPHALNQHCSSRIHEGRNFSCPFCSKGFKVPSAIAHHIESGCHGVTRQQIASAVHRAVQSMNITPPISLSHRIGYTSSPQTITYIATSAAFNGSSYECYLCHRTFRTLPSLNTHLVSPAHDEDEFKCPKCNKRVAVISALVQHIESEVCGVAKFRQVDDYVTALTDRFTRFLKL